MKMSLRVLVLAGLTLSAAPVRLTAQESPDTTTDKPAAAPKQVDQVRIQDGKLIAVADGKTFTPTNAVAMPFNIKVMTNLTFTVGAGNARKLAEGQILSKDGILQSPDGSLMPVLDHVTQKNGRVIVYKDGLATQLTDQTKLSDGSQVMADGSFIDKSGRRTRLLDGQLIKLDGSTLPATDTATLTSGKVVVQKDGALITLQPTQSMMMSNGTKVLGNGTMIGKDGTTSTLAEGQVVKIEGVRRR